MLCSISFNFLRECSKLKLHLHNGGYFFHGKFINHIFTITLPFAFSRVVLGTAVNGEKQAIPG